MNYTANTIFTNFHFCVALPIFTALNSSCVTIMFLQASVILSTEGGACMAKKGSVHHRGGHVWPSGGRHGERGGICGERVQGW